ncbi:MAG: cell division protein FtsL [Lachnospiraceae bacterium]
MHARSQGRRSTSSRGNTAYIQGNTVRKADIQERRPLETRKPLSHAIRKNRDKAVYMNFGYLCFLSLALCFAGFVLIGYIQLQYENTASVKHIARLESQLNTLKLDNDEKYNRIVSSVDLKEIKRVAIEELGMQYAGEEQIVVVSGEEDDYVRQYADLPSSK